MREHLADDLNTPAALHAIDRWAAGAERVQPGPPMDALSATQAMDALLGIDLLTDRTQQ